MKQLAIILIVFSFLRKNMLYLHLGSIVKKHKLIKFTGKWREPKTKIILSKVTHRPLKQYMVYSQFYVDVSC